MLATELTDEQRKTLNDAEAILVSLLTGKEVVMLSLHAGWDNFSTCYFSPEGEQHSSLWTSGNDNKLADKIDRALAIRAEEVANADALRERRIARLKNELAALSVPVA